MPVYTKESEVVISYGTFNVTYGRYRAGTKPMYHDPGDAADVEIVDVSVVDANNEYDDTLEELMLNDDFLDELKEAVIQLIIEDSYCAAEAKYDAEYEDRIFQ